MEGNTEEEERSDKYLKIVQAHWPPFWSQNFASMNDILKKPGRDKMPRSGQDLSTTLMKSFAVMAFWLPFEVASKYLSERIEQRREEDIKSAKHCKPEDVKWVLLNRLEGVGEDMDWKDLAGDALGYREEGWE